MKYVSSLDMHLLSRILCTGLLYTFRVVMERALFLYGPMAMEEMMMTVLLMDMHQVSIQSLLVLLEWMEHPAHLMNSARQKWLLHMLLIPVEILLW